MNFKPETEGLGGGVLTQHIFACTAYDSYDRSASVAAIGPENRCALFVLFHSLVLLHLAGRQMKKNCPGNESERPIQYK